MSGLFDLSGKTALVSGASGALGSAVAGGLAAAGARVVLTGRDEQKLKPLADELAGRGGAVDYVAGQPTDEEAVARIVATLLERHGRVDVLVTAAGMNKPAPIVEQSLADWRAIVDSQLTASWLLCREVGRAMIAQGDGGKVILIGSQRGELGMANYSAYSPAKAAVHLLAKTLAWEWGRYRINVNAIAPGLFRSALTEWMWTEEDTYRRMLTRIPIGRLGEPEDFVGTVVYLASAASDFTTGAVIAVDGGYTAG